MLLGGESSTYLARDSLEDKGDNAAHYSVEYLNTLAPSGLPPYKLLL